MKKSFNKFSNGISWIKLLLLAAVFVKSYEVNAQEKQSVTGKLIDSKDNQAVSFATVALLRASDLKIAGGSMSDEQGVFRLSPVTSGNYLLKVSNIGYKPVTRNIEVIQQGVTDAGIILLQDTSIMLRELVIVGERIRAKSEGDRTTFNVTKSMLEVSNSGTDLLRLIPGVKIDLMQNVSLEGSTDILIFVEGKERDKSFISQLSPDQIDRIEIISALPSDYDGNATGAINIVLRKNRASGLNGHILAEIPVSSTLVYAFPSYSLNWGSGKLNLYTSYNGELTYLNLRERTNHRLWLDNDSNEITINQDLRQKEWSHRFHYGFDYFLSDRDQFNFYGYYNPSSRELDGTVYSQISGTINGSANLVKEDTDLNNSNFYSLYYKHNLKKEGSEITADISNYFLRAENSTDYNTGSDDGVIKGYRVKPKQNIFSLRADYKTPLSDKLILSTGVKAKLQLSRDRYNDFEYHEDIYAIYCNLVFKQEKTDLSIGLRTEKSAAELKDSFINPFLALLPNGTIRYKLTTRQNIQVSFNRTIKRPNIYQLNPAVSLIDPFTISKGNPFIKPELYSSVYLEHSIQFKGNYLSSRLFFNRITNDFNNLMYINDTSTLENQVQNLGSADQSGLQFTGTFKTGFITLNPYIRVFGIRTSVNNIAKQYSIGNKYSPGLESGLSAIASFKHDIACSLTFQFNSAKSEIQGSSFSDALYFLSVEKTFKQKIKLGIVSAMPFTQSFTYNGSKTEGANFQSYYEGNVIMPVIPFWFKLGFQFNSGKTRSSINREKEEIDNLPQKGF